MSGSGFEHGAAHPPADECESGQPPEERGGRWKMGAVPAWPTRARSATQGGHSIKWLCHKSLLGNLKAARGEG